MLTVQMKAAIIYLLFELTVCYVVSHIYRFLGTKHLSP